MNNIDKLTELYDIDLILLTFNNQLSTDNKEFLKIEYNKILELLKKPIGSKKVFKYKFENPGDVIHKMVEVCGYRPDFAINKSRLRKDFMVPRQYAQTISRHIFKHESLKYIGSFFVNANYATVLHSNKTVRNLVQTNKLVRKEFEELQEKILGYVFIKF